VAEENHSMSKICAKGKPLIKRYTTIYSMAKTRFFEVCIDLGEPEAMLVQW
jgi:hypothetical protein